MVQTVKAKFLYIEGIRAIAAVYVMMDHITLSFKLQALTSLNQFVVNFFQYGHFAVDIFIVISGYCLMLPVLNSNYRLPNGILNFYKRRFIRIYPLWAVPPLPSIVL
ncbi:acyltransferase family protein [Mucilaginibacter sp.]|uniref:acyltransferase family protein n=1 Tax=Mucilaginibacter sp. TaxID=1882438 RepID=UPI00345BFC46